MAQQTPNGVFWFSKEVTLQTLRYPGGPTWVRLSPAKFEPKMKVAWQRSGDGGGGWLSGEEEEAESIAASSEEEEEEAVERLLLLPASPTKARG